MAAPVRGARILLTDNMGVRADMTASWLAADGREVFVLDGGYDGALEVGPPRSCRARSRPTATAAPMRHRRRCARDAGLSRWEYGLANRLRRDDTHGFFRDLKRSPMDQLLGTGLSSPMKPFQCTAPIPKASRF